MRGDRQRVIIEEFIDFEIEITLMTVKQKDGPTLFCEPIAHHQERGDYQYSWQSLSLLDVVELREAQSIAKSITDDLGGEGIFGVEFFITRDGQVIFSELSPRPHDTGMVTMFTQNLSEFDLHARAILGLPIPEIKILRWGASHAVLATKEADTFEVKGVAEAMEDNVDVRIFGKPVLRKNRRMAVVLAGSVAAAGVAAAKITFE